MGSIATEYEAIEFTPDAYPPFPDDTKPCADLDTFSLVGLRQSTKEQARLLEVCKTRGFFYLDFAGTSAASAPEGAKAMGRLAEQYFAQPLEEKHPYDYMSGNGKPHSILGYKSVGANTTDAKGTKDTVEFMNVGKDDMLETPGRFVTPTPPLFFEDNNQARVADFAKSCHQAGTEILEIIAKGLGLPADAISSKARLDQPSDDHVRLTRGPPRKTADQPEITTAGHTDFGLITLLFNWLGGLQVWSEPSRGNFHQLFDGAQNSTASAEWLWVKPKPGHAIVNLGDAAVKFSGGLLCSARHRVVPSPGEQGLWPRYSVVYFVRAEDSVVLKRLEGGVIPKLEEGEKEDEYTSAQWIQRQSERLRGNV